jgi:hypothetical protein
MSRLLFYIVCATSFAASPSIAASIIKDGRFDCEHGLGFPTDELAEISKKFQNPSSIQTLELGTLDVAPIPGLTRFGDGWKLDHASGEQTISKWGPIDEVIAKRTNKGLAGEPLFTISFVRAADDSYGERMSLEEYIPAEKGVISPSAVQNSMNKLIQRYRAKYPDGVANYIDLFISIPTHDVVVGKDFVLHAIPPAYMDIARIVNIVMDATVVINCPSPNGYAYRAIFVKGSNVTFKSVTEEML